MKRDPTLLLSHHSLVVLGVNSIKLDSHTVVELTLVDSVGMRDRDLFLAGLAAEDFLGLLLLVVPVLGVSVPLVSKLNSHTVIELTLINSTNMGSWVPGLWLTVRFLHVPVVLGLLLLIIPVLRVNIILITCHEGDVIIKLGLVNSSTMDLLFLWYLWLSISLLKSHNLLSFFLLVHLVLDLSLGGVPVLGVDIPFVSKLNGHTVVEFVLVN